MCGCIRCGKTLKEQHLKDSLCWECIYYLTRYLNRKW